MLVLMHHNVLRVWPVAGEARRYGFKKLLFSNIHYHCVKKNKPGYWLYTLLGCRGILFFAYSLSYKNRIY